MTDTLHQGRDKDPELRRMAVLLQRAVTVVPAVADTIASAMPTGTTTTGMEKMIKRLALLTALLAVSASAMAENASIVGTWALAAADKILPDGSRVPDYGPSPHGLVIFTANGYFSVQIYRAERLKFASGDKFKGTLEEYQDASLSMSVSFGRYTFDPVKHTLTLQTDRSSVPNRDDTTVVRSYELKGGELSWRVTPRQDGSVPMTVLRRIETHE
jgi:Lipocalin-like domain